MNNKYFCGVVSALIAVGLFTGCDSEDYDEPSPYVNSLGDWVDDDGRLVFRDYEDNAISLNGMRFNGMRFNGMRFNGMRFNGMRFNGMRFNGSALNSPTMHNNHVRAQDDQANTLEGTDLENVRFDLDHEDPVTLEITDYEMSHIDVEVLASGLVLQTVQSRELPNGDWVNACENGGKSIQLKGVWDSDTAELISTDPDRTTWACTGGALGDCALWGYVPGNTYNDIGLMDYHQTCLRLKRADYCGNGTHHTENGHSIDVYDSATVQQPATVGTWDVEAMWGMDGAICMNFTRKLDYTKDINDNTKTYIGCEIPDCVDVNDDGVIDFLDYPTALMADRTVPKWLTTPL